jgi:hypothetical protein
VRFAIRIGVAVVLMALVFTALLFIQPPAYEPPPDVVPPRPHVVNTMTNIRDRVLLSQILSPSAKSMHTTLLYGPVTYRLCTYCFEPRRY